MLTQPRGNKILWVLTGLLALVASVAGIWRPGIYQGIVAPSILPGALSQDIISTLAAVTLLYLALAKNGPKAHIVALGLLGYLFYAYGLYVIERAYNGFYLVYMAIFALSFWSLIYAGATFNMKAWTASLPNGLRLVSATGALLQPLIFYPLWIAMLLPLMRTGEQIDSLYSVFILDLCFIMPAFLILATLTYRSRGVGLIMLPALYVLGFTLIFSLALGEVVKPVFNQAPSPSAFWLAVLLSMFFLILGGLHLWRLTISVPGSASGSETDLPSTDKTRIRIQPTDGGHPSAPLGS